MLAVAGIFGLPWQGGAQLQAPLSQSVFLNVPFTTQAPLNEWTDPRQKDGCEEAAILMAMMWVWGIQLPAEELAREITRMADYEKVFYGYHEDTSIEDTAQLMRDYFHYENIVVKENIGTGDIKRELDAGSVVLIPVNTRLFGVSSYLYGPLRHTVVATGYDNQTGDIIINDPMRAWGKGFHIKEAALGKGLYNYMSGVHLPLPPRSTAMLVVSK